MYIQKHAKIQMSICIHRTTLKGLIALLTYNNKKNLLELRKYQYGLQDVSEPNLYRDNFKLLLSTKSHIQLSFGTQ